MARCRVIDPDGNETKLTTMERDLLDVFARHPNRVLTRQQLLDLAHCREEEPFDRSIDIRVTRIRRKIEPNPARPQMIRTVRGSGYMFVPPAFGGNGATTVEFRRRPDLEAASFTRRWAPALESLSA
jgi:two-component system phosphate regulon response regulator OmpR